MMKYPKLPTGPTAFGSAQSRALDTVGGNWQHKNTVETFAKRMGDFRRVEIQSLPEYGTEGRVSPTRVANIATLRYQLPFTIRPRLPFQTPVGGGKYATQGLTDEVTTTRTIYEYEVYPGTTATGGWDEREFPRALQMIDYYRILPRFITFTDFDSIAAFFGGYIMNSRPGAFLGHKLADGSTPESRTAVMPFMTTADERVDSAGRRLGSPAVALLSDSIPEEATFIGASFARPDAEFSGFFGFVVMKNATLWMLAENFFRPGLYDPGTDYAPRVWMLVFPDHDFGGGIAFDITSVAFDGAFIPEPDVSGGLTPGILHYGVYSGSPYNSFLSETMGFMKVVALPNNTALFIYRLITGTTGAIDWTQRILRIEYNGALTGDLIYDELTTDEGLIQDAVHLGENRVLAKKIADFPGTNHAVTFQLSDDGGETWEIFTPVGFDALLLNQFFGNFTVHRPADASREAGDRDATVLINSWNPATGQYHVYESKNNGMNWTRKGMIAKPTTFYRIDQIVVDDGGGNFVDLISGPSYTRPVDITMPDRYERD